MMLKWQSCNCSVAGFFNHDAGFFVDAGLRSGAAAGLFMTLSCVPGLCLNLKRIHTATQPFQPEPLNIVENTMGHEGLKRDGHKRDEFDGHTRGQFDGHKRGPDQINRREYQYVQLVGLRNGKNKTPGARRV